MPPTEHPMPEPQTSPATPASLALEIAVGIAHGDPPPGPEVTSQVRAVASAILAEPPDVIRQKLEALLLGERPSEALQWLHDSGLLATLLPELEATVNFTQEMGRRHKDVWMHTKQVVAQACPRATVRWAALLHDIGKVPTRACTEDGKVTFHGHAEAGARLFDRVARRLAIRGPLRSTVRFLILHHLRANPYDGSWTDSAVRRFDREMGEHLGDLLDLSRADITSARPHRRETAVAQIEALWERILTLRELDAVVPPLPGGLGDAIMAEFGLAPGRLIGRIKEHLEETIESGQIEPHMEATYYIEYLKNNRSRWGGPGQELGDGQGKAPPRS